LKKKGEKKVQKNGAHSLKLKNLRLKQKQNYNNVYWLGFDKKYCSCTILLIATKKYWRFFNMTLKTCEFCKWCVLILSLEITSNNMKPPITWDKFNISKRKFYITMLSDWSCVQKFESSSILVIRKWKYVRF